MSRRLWVGPTATGRDVLEVQTPRWSFAARRYQRSGMPSQVSVAVRRRGYDQDDRDRFPRSRKRGPEGSSDEGNKTSTSEGRKQDLVTRGFYSGFFCQQRKTVTVNLSNLLPLLSFTVYQSHWSSFGTDFQRRITDPVSERRENTSCRIRHTGKYLFRYFPSSLKDPDVDTVMQDNTVHCDCSS